MTSNNDLHHYGVKGMKWGKLKKKLASLRDSIRGRKPKATNTDKPLTKAVNEREREFQYRKAYLHRDQLSTKKLKAMNERLKLENEFDKNTRQKAEDRQKAATEERARKVKARAKMVDGAINVIKNTPIENLITYDKERYRTDKKYKDEVDDKIEGIKSVRAIIGGFSGTASILSQSDDGGVYIGSDKMERERELLLHAALIENEDVLLHGKKWSEEAKARVRQARKAGVSVYEMFSDFYKKSKKEAIKMTNKGIGLAEGAANKSAHFVDGLYESKSEKKIKRGLGRALTVDEIGSGMVNATRNDLGAHRVALAGRPDNGRYSKQTSDDIKEAYNKKIIDKVKRNDKYASKFEKDYLKRPGYTEGMVRATRNDLTAHKIGLAGRPDNGRYSKKTSDDIKEEHIKKDIDTIYSDYRDGRKKYVEETVNPKKRFKFGRLK